MEGKSREQRAREYADKHNAKVVKQFASEPEARLYLEQMESKLYTCTIKQTPTGWEVSIEK